MSAVSDTNNRIVVPVTVKKYVSVSGAFLIPPSDGLRNKPIVSHTAPQRNNDRSTRSVDVVGRDVRNSPTMRSASTTWVVSCTARLYIPNTTIGVIAVAGNVRAQTRLGLHWPSG